MIEDDSQEKADAYWNNQFAIAMKIALAVCAVGTVGFALLILVVRSTKFTLPW